MSKNTEHTTSIGLYYPAEEALLHDWLGLPRPEHLKLIRSNEEPENGLGIWVDDSVGEWDYLDADKAISNAVARIVLTPVQKRLPQVAFVSAEDEVTFGRDPIKRFSRAASFFPQHLFTINWADSAPGVSWPEAYHATFLPGFDCYVVTEAQDGPGIWGVTELAIGHFPADHPVLEGAREVITAYWREQYNGDGQQERWTSVWDEGLVSTDLAEQWSIDVWGEFVEPDDQFYRF
jgi:hypothetical protein